ncbi:retrovirus-related Pol polyprotein from transposon 297 [Trichonephila clavata]|uniref:Retrovirus-related Pol polyprotein from transposon 297 n=1 Tax=Trichonephila clavata TaxID=2740835 RepID=A0A8X6F6R0_TRICU|nr:retrovirus-related Pol polyprotein from transposon 297 [Trichonephila clavata]
MSILRDTGATVDVICQKYVGRDRMKGEHVWVRHLLDDHMTCLPVLKWILNAIWGIVENNKLKERLDEEQIMKLGKVLVKFSTIFSNIPGKTNLVEHNIDLISDKRVQHKPYRMTNRQNEILKAEIERMLNTKLSNQDRLSILHP